jgi:hypothetical protein
MNYTNYILFALGLLGIVIHNLLKMDALNRKQNGEFNFWQYVKLEKFSVLLSICTIGVALLVKHEVKQLEMVGNWLGLAFVAVGYMAQSIIIHFSGRAEKYLNNK